MCAPSTLRSVFQTTFCLRFKTLVSSSCLFAGPDLFDFQLCCVRRKPCSVTPTFKSKPMISLEERDHGQGWHVDGEDQRMLRQKQAWLAKEETPAYDNECKYWFRRWSSTEASTTAICSDLELKLAWVPMKWLAARTVTLHIEMHTHTPTHRYVYTHKFIDTHTHTNTQTNTDTHTDTHMWKYYLVIKIPSFDGRWSWEKWYAIIVRHI